MAKRREDPPLPELESSKSESDSMGNEYRTESWPGSSWNEYRTESWTWIKLDLLSISELNTPAMWLKGARFKVRACACYAGFLHVSFGAAKLVLLRQGSVFGAVSAHTDLGFCRGIRLGFVLRQGSVFGAVSAHTDSGFCRGSTGFCRQIIPANCHGKFT